MTSDVKEHEDVIAPELMKKVNPAKWKDVPLVLNNRNFHWVTEKICGIVEQKNSDLVVVLFYNCTLCSKFHRYGIILSRFYWSWCMG